ncbi:MAG: copper resistance protein CopC [Chloroflexota bacterium]|nr:copper resistance protein CopC [Chloroflexota bacterium]
MSKRRHVLAILLGSALAAVPVAVGAHSELAKSDPAEGANLQTAPNEVVLTFSAELDPAGSGFTVTDGAGAQVGTGTVDLNVAARNVLRGDISIAKPGTYRVSWTSLSLDGDQLQGSVTFGYRPSSPPNTSMLRGQGTDPVPLRAAGMLLLLAASNLLLARRARQR